MLKKDNRATHQQIAAARPPNEARMYLVYIECIIPAGYTACWAAAELHVVARQSRGLHSSVAPIMQSIE